MRTPISTWKLLAGAVFAGAMPSAMMAAPCGTAAAPTTCTITNGGFTYAVTGFSFMSAFPLSDIIITITPDGPAGMKLDFTGLWSESSPRTSTITASYSVVVTGGVLKTEYRTELFGGTRGGGSAVTLATIANSSTVCGHGIPIGAAVCSLPAPALAAAVLQTLRVTGDASASASAQRFGSAFDAMPGSVYQVRYASNLAVGDSVVNLTNTGEASSADGLMSAGLGFQQDGQLCANIYAYSPDEQLVSCCSCNVTPNGLNSLSAKNDLASNTLTPIIPSALVIKIVTTRGGAACSASSAATLALADTAPGLLAWGSTIHALPVTPGSPATTYGLTETKFLDGLLSQAELSRMKSLCAFIRANGSGYGICKSCKIGGLGASAR